MPVAESRTGKTIIGGLLVLAAVVLVVLGAAFGPASRHMPPSSVCESAIGREVVVGGIVVNVTTNQKHPGWLVVELSDSGTKDDDTVKIEYTGGDGRVFEKGSSAVFVGTVKHRGIVRSRDVVEGPEVVRKAAAVDSP